MSEYSHQPRPYNPLEVTVESVDPIMRNAALELLEQAELRVPITEVPYNRRMRVLTEAGDFEFQAIRWESEPAPKHNWPLLCVRKYQRGELAEHMDSNFFVLEGMSVGPTMREPEDRGYIAPGFNVRYRPVKIEFQAASLEYQMASQSERRLLHEAGWARTVSGSPAFITPSVEPHFTQPVTHFDVYGTDQVPARLF